MRYVYLTFALLVSACSVEPRESSPNDVWAFETLVSCNAQWRCEDDHGFRGEVTSTQRFEENETRLCVLNLREQVAGLGLCGQKRSELIPESINVSQDQVKRRVLTLASENGKLLHKLADEIIRLSDRKCEGDECFEYWKVLGSRYDDLDEWRVYVLKKEVLIAENIGKRLKLAAERICRMDHAGGGDYWMDFLTKKTATAGKALIELQVKARLEDIKTCQKMTGEHRFGS